METIREFDAETQRSIRQMDSCDIIPLREFVTEAVKDKLASDAKATEKPWVKHIGKLKHLRKETARINRLIEEDSEKIDPEMWR